VAALLVQRHSADGELQNGKRRGILWGLYHFMVTSFKIWKKYGDLCWSKKSGGFTGFFCGLLLMKIEDSRQSTEKDQ